MTKNPVKAGTIESYTTDYGPTLNNQIRYKFVGEPGIDNDTEFPKALSNQICFVPTSDGQEKCLPKDSPIEPRHFILSFNNAQHKMPVAGSSQASVRTCGSQLVQGLPLLKCIGYRGESVKNLHLLVR